MRKSTVIELYNKVDNKDIIINSLPRMIDVKGKAEDIFYKLCIKYNDILDIDILDSFIAISTFTSSIGDSNMANKILNSINAIFDNDYLVSNLDFNIILENIQYIFCIEALTIFDVYDEEEEKYYISEIIIELSKALSKSKNYDINKIYNHDFNIIFSRFFYLLEDLNNTYIPNSDDFNKTLMDRIRLFLDIIFTKEIYELDDYKYNVVLDIASTIENNTELSKFKSKILFYGRLNNNDFVTTIDDSVDTLTDTSIKLLKEGKNKTLKFDISNNK